MEVERNFQNSVSRYYWVMCIGP